MIEIRFTTLDRPDAVCAYAVIANGQPIGEVRQVAGGMWRATPTGRDRSMLGFRDRSEAVEALLDWIGALG